MASVRESANRVGEIMPRAKPQWGIRPDFPPRNRTSPAHRVLRNGPAAQVGACCTTGGPPLYRPYNTLPQFKKIPQTSAPPVYRPARQADLNQAKLADGAPPVYRPGNVPAQRKSTPRPFAPPVYRPDRQAGPSQAKPANGAPPVYRPDNALLQSKSTVRTPAPSVYGVPRLAAVSQTKLAAGAPAVYRPDNRVPSFGKSGFPATQAAGITPAAFKFQTTMQMNPSSRFSGIAVRQNQKLHANAQVNVVQRLVYLLSEDVLEKGTYRNLVQNEDGYEDPTRSLRPIPDLSSPFATLERNESLHIIVHGGGGTVQGMSGPAEFAEFLVGRGLDPDKHRGTIRLISCFSGTPNLDGTTFAEQFAGELRKKGFTNPVIGFDGLVRAGSGGRIFVIPPGQAGEFFRLSRRGDRLKKEFQELQSVKPTGNSSQDEIEVFIELAKGIKDEIEDVNKKMAALWVPQAIGKNIIHIPEVKEYMGDMPLGTLSQRRQEDREWEEWQTQKMRAFGMLGENESIRPRTDFSSEYIS